MALNSGSDSVGSGLNLSTSPMVFEETILLIGEMGMCFDDSGVIRIKGNVWECFEKNKTPQIHQMQRAINRFSPANCGAQNLR